MEFAAAPRVPVFVLIACCAAASAQDGATVYRKHCAQCHDAGLERAPQPSAMKLLSPERVVTALTSGKMAEQGRALTAAETRAVATFVTGKAFGGEDSKAQGFCADPAEGFDKPFSGPYWNGWGRGSG